MSGSEADSTGPDLRIEERLTARMARLERRHGRLRWLTRGLIALTAILLVLVAVPLMEPTPRDGPVGRSAEIRAERFVLLDSMGARRGAWRVAEDGAVRLTVHDDAGRARLNLAVLRGGSPGISFSDDEERRRVVLGLLPDQTSTLVFADRAGVARAVFGLSRNQAVNLLFADEGGVGRVGLGLDASGRESLMLPGLAEETPRGMESEETQAPTEGGAP